MELVKKILYKYIIFFYLNYYFKSVKLVIIYELYIFFLITKIKRNII